MSFIKEESNSPNIADAPQTPDKVARFYQEELLRLMSRPGLHQENNNPPPPPTPTSFNHLLRGEQPPYPPGMLFPFLGQNLLFQRRPEDVKLALEAYQQELSKLQGAAPPAPGLGLGAAGN